MPFLLWVGGKTQLRGKILKKNPIQQNRKFTHLVPFIGIGAVFFLITIHNANIVKSNNQG